MKCRSAQRFAPLLAACFLFLFPCSMLAGPGHGQGTGHGDGHAETGAIKEHKGEGDHWSFFSEIVPEAAVENAKNAIGLSYFEKERATRVMHVPASIFAALVALFFGLIGGRRFRNTEKAIRPSPSISVAGIVELLFEGIYNIAASVMDEKWARKSFPLLATITIYVLVCNLMGSFPGFFPPTDNLNTTMSMAILVFFATHIYGLQAQGIAYFKHFLGPIIKWYALPLMLLMLVIETIGHLARPVSLSIRLMGNMTADHKVLAIFLGFGILVVPIPIQILGLIVATVQALVFLLLSAVYIGLAVDHGEAH